MSWSQQRPGSAAPPPERAPYAPSPHPPQAQVFGNHQNMYTNYPGGAPATGNTQQQYWQAQQPLFNQQYGQQVYQQQDFGNNANQLYQQPTQYSQNYNNQSFTSAQPQGYQQNYYTQGAQVQNYQNKPNADNWEDNWDWGWEDSSKQSQQVATGQGAGAAAPLSAQSQQQQVFNNANVIEESFSNTDNWSWSTDDKKEKKEPTPKQHIEPSKLVAENSSLGSSSELSAPTNISNLPLQQQATEEVRNLGDREMVKERLPNLAVGKRLHLDNLTPQWSIESQMSQESSDGPLTYSEGTYRSDNHSRNSSKSSPGPNTDNSNFNYSQSGFEDWSHRSNEDSTLVDNADSSSRKESHSELSAVMQDMNITNRENPPQSKKERTDTKNMPDNMLPNLPPPSTSPSNFPLSSAASMPPPPPVLLSGDQTLTGVAASPSSIPPPMHFSSVSNSNPFKQTGQFSHKKVSSASPSLQTFPTATSNTNQVSPSTMNKTAQHRIPVGFGANLETTPDNSERPDQPHVAACRQMPVTPQIPDNLEIAPQNDRNEYLQTAHLSSGDYGENTDFSRNVPPPGFRRMVVGQQESEYNQNMNMSGDEPPPGLARMVPGQQNETDNNYNQPSDSYRERLIDGQPTEGGGRPFRQADGQQNPNYSQPSPARASERRPIGFDRMVPGESSNNEFSQYQGNNYSSNNEERVVTGVDHDYPIEVSSSEVREQNVDGSDYSEHTPRTAPRGQSAGARDANNDVPTEYNAGPEEQQREVVMEGENLQDLSIISSVEINYSREQTLDGVDLNATDTGIDRKTDASDSLERPATSSRRQSLNRVNTSGEESDRDRAFKASPRRDRDKHKSSRDRDREDGRFSRSERKYDREADRNRSDKDRRDRRERDESPHSRRHRRSARSHRYETEDTDYYSDKERERRRYREGSYASKPPRPDDKDRRYEDRERGRRYATIERDRYGERRSERRDRDRHEARYRDIDPTRKHANLRLERDDDERRRGEGYAGRGLSREARERDATDEEAPDHERRRERRRDRRDRDRTDPYYDVSAYNDPYLVQRQQYQYYEHLRLTNPAAYMQVYKQLMAGRAPHHKYPQAYADVFGQLGFEGRSGGEERGSVHSGRSSANGGKGNDTYFGMGGAMGGYPVDGSLRDAPSLRTDLSDRDLNTDASLNLHLEESTVRSERMTPFKFSTAHVKGNISSLDVVVVRPSYPVDGLPATVQILSLSDAMKHDPMAIELAAFPGPLVKGVTHKKSVIDYCTARRRNSAGAGYDVIGYALVWDLLALMLRQNGLVVGTDIAELLLANAREFHYDTYCGPAINQQHNESRRASSSASCRSGRERDVSRSSPDTNEQQHTTATSEDGVSSVQTQQSQPSSAVDERAALDKYREYLTYGRRQEALEHAMSNGLWSHALALSWLCERRARAQTMARFIAAHSKRDELHTLYAHLSARAPPALAGASDPRWGDWRPHAAIVLSNTSAKPEHDRKTLMQLGEALSSRGLIYSAQFCYLAAGARPGRHPLTPLQPALRAGDSRVPAPLTLLLADPRATTLSRFATNRAIFATEVLEYALSLNGEGPLEPLQPLKLLVASRLADCGQYERALAYVEAASRAVTQAPAAYAPALVLQLARLAERLSHHDPALHDDPPIIDDHHNTDSGEPSPRHQQWLDDVQGLARTLATRSSSLSAYDAGAQAQLLQPASAHGSPQHQSTPLHSFVASAAPPAPTQHDTYNWSEQSQQQYQPAATGQYVDQEESAVDYSQYYQQQQQHQQQPTATEPAASAADQTYAYDEWQRTNVADATATQHAGYGDTYWHGRNDNYYQEGGANAESAEDPPRPNITMPGACAGGGAGSSAGKGKYADYDDDRPDSDDGMDRDSGGGNAQTQKQKQKQDKSKDDGGGSGGGGGKGKSGWLGGLFTKLSLRPPNQMILPDDKNPSIVWDEEKKRWRNVDSAEEEATQPPPPPPTTTPAAAIAGSHAQIPPSNAPPGAAPPPVSNIFKMQKSRHIKKSYVDVFNPGGASRPLPPAGEVLGPAAPLPAQPTYFVPQPMAQAGVYDPTHSHDDRYNTGI